MIIDKRLSVDRVANRIQEEYEEFLNVMFSDENAEQLVLRIRCVYVCAPGGGGGAVRTLLASRERWLNRA